MCRGLKDDPKRIGMAAGALGHGSPSAHLTCMARGPACCALGDARTALQRTHGPLAHAQPSSTRTALQRMHGPPAHARPSSALRCGRCAYGPPMVAISPRVF